MFGYFEEGCRLDEDGSPIPSPFLEEKHAGALRIFGTDNVAIKIMSMNQASGFGLHVGVYTYPECCWGSYGFFHDRVVRIGPNTPLLLPSLVHWASIIDSTGSVYEVIKNNYGVDYPCVAVSSVDSCWSDFRWSIDNLNYDYSGEIHSYEPQDRIINFTESNINTMGLLPIWTVMPFSKKYVDDVQSSITNLHISTGYPMLNECWCSVDWMECSDDCDTQSNYRNQCTCNIREQTQEAIDKAIHEPTNPITQMNEITQNIWQGAIQNFYFGWSSVYQLKEEEAWAYYSWRLQSPFADLPGQAESEQQAWIDLTSSETQLESLPAS